MIPMRPWRLVHWKNIPEELCFASIMGLICTAKTYIKTEMYFRTLKIKKKPAHLEISGRMNEKENEAANLCKIRTSVLYADSVFGPTCLEIFSKHVRLTSL